MKGQAIIAKGKRACERQLLQKGMRNYDTEYGKEL